MKTSVRAVAFALPFLFGSALAAEPVCDGLDDTCLVEQDDPSAIQLRAGVPNVSDTPGKVSDVIENMKEEAKRSLQKIAASFKYMELYGSSVQAENCSLDSSNSCPITDSWIFTPKTPTKILPGGKTQCIDGSEYFFEVTVGDLEKLHIHFQGGGACWDKVSYNFPGCTLQASENPPNGIFNLTNPENPLKDYSLIVIQYCSGDMHAGDAEQDWGEDGAMVKQAGYHNADAAIQYALGQFPKLQNLVLSGSSAGSLGLQFWSSKVINLFACRKADVSIIADSFLGVLWPPNMVQTSEAWLYDTYNMCNPNVLTPAQLTKCNGGTLLLQDMFVDSMKSHSGARFSVVNSKNDTIQIGFERAFELTAQHSLVGAAMTTGQFCKEAQLMVVDYLKQDNLFSYFVDGLAHTYLPYDYLYTTSPEGSEVTSGSPALIEWLTKFVSPEQEAAKSVCYGKAKHLTPLTPVGPNQTDYCAEGLNSVQR